MEYLLFFGKFFVGVLSVLLFVAVGSSTYEIIDWLSDKLGHNLGLLAYIIFVSFTISGLFTLFKFLAGV